MNTTPPLNETETLPTIYSMTVDGQTFDFAQPTYRQVDHRVDYDDMIEGMKRFTKDLVVEAESKYLWVRAVKADPNLALLATNEILDRIGLGLPRYVPHDQLEV